MTTTASLSTTSATGLGLSGLSSGLDTSGIITKLMSVESAPQTALKTQLTSATGYRTALQALNSSIAGVATSAQAATAAGALSSFTATSDASSVSATASSTASAGSVSFTVDRLATAQASVSTAMTTWNTASYGSFTIRRGGDSTTDTPITPASSSLDDVVTAINSSSAGVTASKIAVGSGQYRLQLRSETGAANAFTLSAGSTYSSDSTAAMGFTAVSTAQDASITLYKGIAGAETAVTSNSNTFGNLITGVSVTVSAVSSTAATVKVAADSTAATTAAQSLTASLITLFSGIATASAITTTTSDSGSTSSTSGSVFTADSAVRAVNDALLTAVSGAVDNKSPSSIGINLTKDGTITFDSAKFAAAMASDPAGTTSMFQTIAGRVATAATGASDPYTGTITNKITSQQTTESSLTKQISDWDTRLATIQAQYTATYNALETALQSLNSQASYLTSQISGLTTNYQTAS